MIFSKLKISAIISLAFLICAFGVNALSEYLSQSSIDKIGVEHTIHEKQHLASVYLEQIKSIVFKENFTDATEELLSIIDENAADNQIYVAIYKNWNLKIWPSHRVVLPDVYDPDIFNGNLIRLGYSYFIPTHARHNNTDIIILTFIKNQFNSENEYLKCNYADEFHLSGDIKLTQNPLAKNIIFDIDGNFLFSLESESQTLISDILFWIALLFFLGSIVGIFRFIESIFELLNRKLTFYASLLITVAITVGLRVFMIQYDIPSFLQKSDMFTPELFASSWYNPSIGDYMLNAFWIFFIILLVFSKSSNRTKQPLSKLVERLELLGSGMLLSLFALLTSNSIPTLISNSSIEFEMYKIIGITGYTFLGLLIVLTLISCYLMLVDLMLQNLRSHSSLYRIAKYQLPLLILSLQISNTIQDHLSYNILFFVSATAITYYYQHKNGFRHTYAVLIVFLSALYFVLSANESYNKKWIESKKVKAYILTSNIDIATDHQLLKICDDIVLEPILNKILATNHGDFVRASNYVHSHYFS